MRFTSQDGSKEFEDNSLDFVYLDGDHSAGEVKKDIDYWLPKVKVGGILGGHDAKEPCVIQGYNDFMFENKEYAGKVQVLAIDWWLIK